VSDKCEGNLHPWRTASKGKRKTMLGILNPRKSWQGREQTSSDITIEASKKLEKKRRAA